MKTYKLNHEELVILGRFDTAFRSASIQAAAVQEKMVRWITARILPKMGIKQVPGTALPIDIKLEEGIIEVGIAKIEKRIIVPKGMVKRTPGNDQLNG